MRLNYTSLNRSPTSLSYLLSSGFKPASLFAQSEPGVWLDPSDVADLAWRRNLLTYSEQFTNAIWTKTNVTVTENAAVAPDGTMTAESMVPNTTGSAVHGINDRSSDTATVIPTGAYVLSVYAKSNGYNWFRLRSFDGTTDKDVWFNLSAGQVGTASAGAIPSITSVGNGWYRCSIQVTASTSISLRYSSQFFASPTDNIVNFAGDGTSGILLWGAQLELGSTATPYQRISDVTTEVLEQFPTATLFQDTAGTTPVTTPGQPVGLVLDKSKGLVLGPELVTNGNFSGGSTGWSVNGGWSISGGAANAAIASGFGDVRGNSNLTTIGRTYRLTFTLNVVSGGVRWYLGGVTASTTITSSGTYSVLVLATDVQYVAFIAYGSGGAFTGSVDNISVREIPGNHATQATSASRPTYGIEPLGGRRNLLTRTEEFDNAAWTKGNATVTANAAAATDGTITADAFIPTVTNGIHYLGNSVTRIAGIYTYSVYAKPFGYPIVALQIKSLAGTFKNASFNVSTGTVVASSGAISTSITVAGNGWYRCSFTFNNDTGTESPNDAIFVGSAGSDWNSGFAGDGTSGILICGAQLELGSTATAYQRVGTAFDVTETGVASVSYLSFDGVDDWLVTPTIDPAASAVTGAELVTNGDFSGGSTGWISTSWVISGGKATISNVSDSLAQNVALVAGKAYRVEYTLSGFSGTGAFRPRFFGGTTVTGTSRSTDGTYVEIMTAVSGNTQMAISVTSATCSGSVDNISVREIIADKAQVFAGVRKLSDAAIGVVVELSADTNSNNGTIWMIAPQTAGAANANFASKGTILAGATRTDFAAPVTAVMTGLGNISGDLATLRVNGIQAAQSTADQGTGNYLSYPLYIGRRAGTSLPFNGQIYSLIVRFGTNLATDQIASIESSVGSKTGFFAPTITGVPTIGVS